MILNSPYITGSLTVTGNITASGGITISGSISSASYAANADRVDGLDSTSFVFTSSYNVDSGSMSSRVTTIESKYATTGSNIFQANQTICGNLTTTGTITAQTINVQQVTSSIVYSSGSNIFGNTQSNTQQFTGSMFITGSTLTVTGGTICTTGNTCFGGMSIVSSCLGVGTVSPAAELQVNKTCDVTIAMSNCSSVTTGNRGTLSWYNSSVSSVAAIRATAVTDNVGTQLEFYTRPVAGNFTQRMILDSSGNLGVGIAPGCWCAVGHGNAIQVGCQGLGVWGRNFKEIHLTNNYYYHPTTARTYAYCACASDYEQFDGAHAWYTAPWGSPGNALTFNSRFQIFNSGIACFACQVCAPTVIITTAGTACTVTDILTLANNQTGLSSICAGAGILFTGNGGSTVARIYSRGNMNQNNGSDLVFQTQVSAGGGPQCTMVINGGSQNVGIGTFTPACKLDIDGGSSAVGLRISTTNTGAGVAALILANSSKSAFNDGMIMTHGGGYTNITSLSGATIMAWDMSSCRVGIGTTTPVSPLHINAGAISSAGTSKAVASFRTCTNVYLDICQGNAATIAGQSITGTTLVSTDDLAISTTGTERMRITSGANFQRAYSSELDKYVSMTQNVQNTLVTITSSANSLIRVVLEYVAYRNNSGVVDYQSGRYVVFYRANITTVSAYANETLGTSFLTWNVSLSSNVLTIQANPGAANNSAVFSTRVLAVSADAGTTISIT